MRIAILSAAAAVATSGCSVAEMPLRDGASELFMRMHVCPEARLMIKPRPDLPPHVVIPPGPIAAPPADIASDSERVRLWRNLQPDAPDLDKIGATFEVSGCNTTTLLVCAHPRDDGNQTPWSAGVTPDLHVTLYTDSHADLANTTAVSDHIVRSSVVCLPGTAPAR